jgi:dienelactone hydrolase
VFRRGTGPGVIIIHEIPGITPEVLRFAEDVVAAGFTVLLPSLLGTPGAPVTARAAASSLRQLCVSREFTKLGLRQTSPIASWLRSLARTLHEELGGPGVGALGMCYSGGFALAMMVDAPVTAPVVAQPSLPFPIGRARGRDVNLSDADLAAVKEKTAAGCPVLGLRFTDDAASAHRFDTLREQLGGAFEAMEFPGRKHSTLTTDRQEEGVRRVLDFFRARLLPA